MNGKINERGILEIERAGTYKEMYCPYDTEGTRCGDWCPLFGEPLVDRRVSEHAEIFIFGLDLCKRTLYFANFEDKRKGGKK